MQNRHRNLRFTNKIQITENQKEVLRSFPTNAKSQYSYRREGLEQRWNREPGSKSEYFVKIEYFVRKLKTIFKQGKEQYRICDLFWPSYKNWTKKAKFIKKNSNRKKKFKYSPKKFLNEFFNQNTSNLSKHYDKNNHYIYIEKNKIYFYA